MFTIKEFADFTGLSESKLRYYDKIGLISPARRGDNGYRFYLPLQALTVDFIKVLIKVGVPLSTIKTINRKKTLRSVLALLAQQEKKLDVQLKELQTTYTVIHAYRNTLQTALLEREHDIYVGELDEMSLIFGQEYDYQHADAVYEPFMQFCNTAHEYGINLHYPVGRYYENMDTFLRTPAKPTKFFSQDPSGNSSRSAGQYLVAHYKSYYGEFEGLAKKLLAYVKANGLTFRGPVYMTYLWDETVEKDQNQYMSQFVAGVSNTR